ncbi:SCA7, zinc-binding domain-containing protein [Scheffersomyces coipomensis]|uniref:SCA7, zinc-binding domain-containing protein n=1 Tax=Scheffersomyces coipomensis TaxID=1788519 RepID=UPI00315CB36B
MSTTARAQQVISLASLRSLNNSTDNSNIASDSTKKPIVWKDLGAYLDKKIDIQTNSSHNNNLSIPDSLSYLSTNIKYKICKSCNRPIGETSLANHYTKCVALKQKKEQEAQIQEIASTNNTNNNMINKRKRGKQFLDIETSSVESSRNTTPIPGTPSNGATSSSSAIPNKPKKKYKKSQTQKEKEAANAAAAAAAAAYQSGSQNDQTESPVAAGSDKKKKKQPKPKAVAKPKGPVDVEKQCGVPLASGGFCARSLTCKTHPMGAKRAVLGRSAPYDVLLQQYQKRNQAKIAANNALAAQRRENAAFHGGGQDMGGDGNLNYNKILDPDEETHLVLEGLSKNNPIPLERKIVLPVRYRHRFLSGREFYANSLIKLQPNQAPTHNSGTGNNPSSSGGNSSGGNAAGAGGAGGASGPAGESQNLATQAISGSIGGLQGRCALINVDASPNNNYDSPSQTFSSIPGEIYQVRAPSRAIATTAQYNLRQQDSFQKHFFQLQQKQQQQMLLLRQRQQQQQQQAQQQQQTQQAQPVQQNASTVVHQ